MKILINEEDLKKMSEEERKNIELNLIDYDVYVEKLLWYDDCQAYYHLACVPTKLLKDIDVLECVIKNPRRDEEYRFNVNLDKGDWDEMTILDVDRLLCNVAKAFFERYNKGDQFFKDYVFDEIVINSLILKGNSLTVIIYE